MTRFIHDKFAKDYLEELLKPLGKVEASRRVAGEVREIDVWFAPNDNPTTLSTELGLLGKIAANPCIVEPFRNPVTSGEILDCMLKLLEIRGEQVREANRQKTTIAEDATPKLWILTPTASAQLLSRFGATLDLEKSGLGIYFLPTDLRTAIVVIHQLPKTQETLWLRILGRGKVQKAAIDELVALPVDNPFRENTLKLFYSLQKNLEGNREINSDDKELIMRLSPLYQQDREKAIQEGRQEGRQEGERLVIENLLRVRFGSLDEELLAIIDPLLVLPPEEFTRLSLQLSREELIARFHS